MNTNYFNYYSTSFYNVFNILMLLLQVSFTIVQYVLFDEKQDTCSTECRTFQRAKYSAPDRIIDSFYILWDSM